MFLSESSQGIVEGDNIIVRSHKRDFHLLEVNAFVVAAPFQSSLAARLFHENSPHSFSSGGEEVATAVPVLGLFHVDQA